MLTKFFFDPILGKIDNSEKKCFGKGNVLLMAKLAKTFLTMIIKVDDLPFFFCTRSKSAYTSPLKKIKFAMKNGLLFPSFLQWA